MLLAAESGGDAHHIVFNVLIIGGSLLFIGIVVIAVVRTAAENASSNVPDLLRRPHLLLIPLGAFAIVGVIAFGAGASTRVSAIIGGVAGGLLLLKMMFGE
jgi:hypothetical protein